MSELGVPLLNACTIISWNYLAYARSLARTLRQWNPEARLYVAIADRPTEAIDVSAEPFVIVPLAELGIPRVEAMAFRYTILELNTAIKPYLLQHLHDTYQVEHLFYFDPDIVILGNLSPLMERFGSGDLVLTPHVTEPVLDTLTPDETDLIGSGIYNLGFLGVHFTAETSAFLRWWQDRLYTHCLSDPRTGVFTDQKWVDFAPALVGRTCIARDAGWNVAYWNLRHRRISRAGDRWLSNGEPLLFFHYSGLDLSQPGIISKYQPQTSIAQRPDVKPLLDFCRESLLAEGHEQSRSMSYGFARFDNGVEVTEVLRRILRNADAAGLRWPDPFRTGASSFYEWLLVPSESQPELPNVAVQLQQVAETVKAVFHELGSFPADYAKWVLQHNGRWNWRIPDPLTATLAALVSAPAKVQVAASRSARGVLVSARPLWKRVVSQNPVLARKVSRVAKGVMRRAGMREPFDDIPKPPDSPVPPEGAGVNVVGWLTTPTGVGEISRGTIAAAEAAGIRHAEWNLRHPVYPRAPETAGRKLPWDVTIFHANADMIEGVQWQIPSAWLRARARIGVWFWELSHFPLSMTRAFHFLDELWAPTQFCLEAFRPVCPIPLRLVPPCVVPVASDAPTRFGLSSDHFLFFSHFDALSIPERKNPAALLDAFELALKRSARPLHLALKIGHAARSPELLDVIRARTKGLPVTIIEESLPRQAIGNIVAGCDAYVSLHRSEGFGIPLVEAMYAKKPVIATPYGGCSDFLDETTGWCVPYALVQLDRDYGPYPAGAVWADPSAESASALMLEVSSGPSSSVSRIEAAHARVTSMYSPAVAGERLRRELDRVRRDAVIRS